MKSVEKKNLWLGSAFLFISVVVFRESAALESTSAKLPILCSWAIVAFGVLLIAGSLRAGIKARRNGPESEKSGTPGSRLSVRDTVVISAALVAASLGISFLGFYTTITVLIFFVFIFYGKSVNGAAIRNGIVFSLTTIFTLYIIFGLFMKLPAPRGLFL